jgi:hypothetical protein
LSQCRCSLSCCAAMEGSAQRWGEGPRRGGVQELRAHGCRCTATLRSSGQSRPRGRFCLQTGLPALHGACPARPAARRSPLPSTRPPSPPRQSTRLRPSAPGRGPERALTTSEPWLTPRSSLDLEPEREDCAWARVGAIRTLAPASSDHPPPSAPSQQLAGRHDTAAPPLTARTSWSEQSVEAAPLPLQGRAPLAMPQGPAQRAGRSG